MIEKKKPIRIKHNRWYVVVDYLGNALPTLMKPFKKEGSYYVCENEKGGIIHVKGTEFIQPPLPIRGIIRMIPGIDKEVS